MSTAPPHPYEPTPEDDRRRLARAERLLACYRQAVGHELPNQLVAIQGLVRVLEFEEGARLSAEGRDYLQRLAAAAQRTHALLRTLAAIGRVGREPVGPEPLALADVV